jgi:uncharacterized repeat protein (TIGR02543 family)
MRFATRRVVQFFVLCFALWSGAVVQSQAAGPYTLLHGFAGGPSDGAGPGFNCNLATDGTTLYGVTITGGITNRGVLFKIGVNGSGYQVMHYFNGLSFTDLLLGGTGNTNDGVNPEGTPLLIGSTLYGATSQGGTNGLGTVYKINTDGNGFQLLHSFGVNTLVGDGSRPQCSLVTDGTNLYGMTVNGTGTANDLGTIFKMDTNGSNYTVLHNFGVQTNNGNSPQGSLVISGGTLYGMTQMGGILGSGTLFKIGTDGLGFQIIHHFTGVVTDGASPYGSPILSGTTLYGMTSNGGTNNVGCVFSVDTSGNGFQLVHSFSLANTWQPYGDLTFGSNSVLYGMTHIGGTNGLGFGTIFQVNTDGTSFKILHEFFFATPSNLTDGSTPYASLLFLGSQLYGMTFFGGSAHNAGAIFSFTPPGGGGGGGGGGVTGLQVEIQPAGAVKAGAMWQVDNGAFFKSDVVVTGLSVGPHTVAFKPVTGWAAPSSRLIPVLANFTNFVTGTYTAVDSTPPVLKVISPTSKTVVSSNLFTASGTASDNVGVALVFYQLNSGAWIATDSSDSFTNWTAANLNLIPGVNVMKFYAKDLSGNVSPTNTISFTYVVSAPLVVNIYGPGAGTLKPNLNGQLLQIGKLFSMSVKATKGYAFVNWTGGTNTTSPKITFVMASNLTFTANFKDITRPVNVILSPTKGQIVTAAEPTATGKAMDNAGVTAVWFRVNGGAWTSADLVDGTNWHTASLSSQLLAGPNTISAYAQDAAGNASLTNTIAFTYVVQPAADWAPDSLNGLLASVTPATGSPESVGFDLSTFAQTSTTNSTDPADNGGGTYTYLKIDTNLAQLSLSVNLPPGTSNSVGPIDLVFTNHYAGYFTNEDGGDTGQISLNIASAFVPATVVGKTLSAVSSSNGKAIKIKLATATGFTKTPANNSSSGSSSGTYTFTRLSPVCGVFAFAFTSPADLGQTAYVQATYTSATGGTYFAMVFDSFGALQNVDEGHFTM